MPAKRIIEQTPTILNILCRIIKRTSTTDVSSSESCRWDYLPYGMTVVWPKDFNAVTDRLRYYPKSLFVIAETGVS